MLPHRRHARPHGALGHAGCVGRAAGVARLPPVMWPGTWPAVLSLPRDSPCTCSALSAFQSGRCDTFLPPPAVRARSASFVRS